MSDQYRGKLNCSHRTSINHLRNALSVISNLCAYHNSCEPHRMHPPIESLVPAILRDSSVGESGSDDEKVEAAAGDADAEMEAAEAESEEKQQPARKRQRRHAPVHVHVMAVDEAHSDPHRSRPDYGQHEYKWQADIGTDYSAEQFKRQQAVWVWDGGLETWLAAVVTYIARAGAVYVRTDVSDERLAIPAHMVRPRL
jgi:hypothetical protein